MTTNKLNEYFLENFISNKKIFNLIFQEIDHYTGDSELMDKPYGVIIHIKTNDFGIEKSGLQFNNSVKSTGCFTPSQTQC